MNRRQFCKLSTSVLIASTMSVAKGLEEQMEGMSPQEYTGALRNPLKGLRSGDVEGVTKHPYASLAKAYIRWNELENSSSDSVERIREYCDHQWKALPALNTKVIPRVYLEWPNRGRYWPADMTTGDYSSAQFKQRLVGLIEKLGEAWNRDPRVAFVETGLIGLWGEQHDPSPSLDLQKLMGDAYVANFPAKLLMNRYPGDFVNYEFGIYWDSFGHKEESPGHIPLLKSSRLAERWRIAPMGGETAFDWGTPLGKDPTDAVVNNSDRIIALIRDLHWNHLGWLSDYDVSNQIATNDAARIQKALGYRLVIDEIHYPARIDNGADFEISFRVRNTGSGPLYYSWPLEFSLLDPTTKKPVWKAPFAGLKTSEWLPGSEGYEVNGNFKLSAGLQKGAYVGALSILDPASGEPSVRFAITNYFNGGRHPFGWITVGTAPTAVGPLSFDNPALDESLRFSLMVLVLLHAH